MMIENISEELLVQVQIKSHQPAALTKLALNITYKVIIIHIPTNP
jgi:hypothetical protein